MKTTKNNKLIYISIILFVVGLSLISYAAWSILLNKFWLGRVIFTKQAKSTESVKYKINNNLINYPIYGDFIGNIYISSINLKAPIFQGDDAVQLKKGVGHSFSSLIPGEGGNDILSAHRDTIFKDLGKVKIGDAISIKTFYGTYNYRVSKIKIVDKTDTSIIVKSNKEMLTVYTCYPFHYIGAAPKRYIITCDFIDSNNEKDFN